MEHVQTTTPGGVNVVISKNHNASYADDSKQAPPPPTSTGDTSLTELAGEGAGDDIEIDGQSFSIFKLRPRDLVDFAKKYNATIDAVETLPPDQRAEAQQYLNWLVLHRNGYEPNFEIFLDDEEALQLSMRLAEEMEEQGFLQPGIASMVTEQASRER